MRSLLGKAPLAAYACVGAAVFLCCFLFKSYSANRNAQVFVERWVAANFVALQEGNFLEEVAKLERVLSAQIDVSGVVLIDLRAPEVPLAAMGDVDVIPRGIWQGITVAPKVISCGLLKPCVAVRLPGLGGNLALALVVDNKGEIFSLVGFTVVIAILIGAGLLITAWQYRRSNRETLATISNAFSAVIKDDPQSIEWAGLAALLGEPLNQTFGELRARIEKSAVHEAIARMTGMLAHDVRKPFSILRMALGMLGNAKDPASVKKVLARVVPEIDKAVSSVDGLIADVMEVGSTSTELIQEPASPESLIEATLGETFRIYPKAEIALTYELNHTHMVNVHVQKVGRVFSNIVGNAVQAMGQKGKLWFKTTERDGFVEFCLGNAGSVIPAENLSKLFEAFFTSGKKGGTGLGLAIAQKVVTAHGGKIWCESSRTAEHPDGKVEFIFTLPVAEGQLSKTTTSLPLHSSTITMALLTLADNQTTEGSTDKGELTLEADIIQARNKLGRKLRVLVVDDEAVYRSALAAYLSRTAELSEAIEVTQADGSKAALGAVEDATYDLVITDVDMGPDSLDGFDLVRALRQIGLNSLVCVHSNRIVAADHKNATAAGADAFLPKPVARAQLLRLALQAVEAAQQELAVVKPLATAVARQGAVAADKGRPEVLVVDDNPFILDAWSDVLRAEATVHAFTSLEALTERLAKDPEFIGRLSFVVTDMHLDGSSGDGLDVGRLLKSQRPSLLVLLSSDGIFKPEELVGAVDRVISKDPVGLSTLAASHG